MSHRLITILLATLSALLAHTAHAQYYPQPSYPNQAPQSTSSTGRGLWSRTDSVFILYDGESAFEELDPREVRRLEKELPPRRRLRPERTARPVYNYSGLQLQSNLLYVLAVTPNAGIAYQTGGQLRFALSGAWAGWEIDGGAKRYKLWLLNPEARWMFGQRKEWFVGAQGYLGQFNMRINDIGYQGDAMGGGIIAGRRIPLTDRLALDVSAGGGFVDMKYESYSLQNGTDMLLKTGLTRAYFGPTHLGVTLVWKINRY